MTNLKSMANKIQLFFFFFKSDLLLTLETNELQ